MARFGVFDMKIEEISKRITDISDGFQKIGSTVTVYQLVIKTAVSKNKNDGTRE